MLKKLIERICKEKVVCQNVCIYQLDNGNSLATNYCVYCDGIPYFFAKTYQANSDTRYQALKYLQNNCKMIVPLVADIELKVGWRLMIMKWVNCEQFALNGKNARDCASLLKEFHCISVPEEYPKLNICTEIEQYVSFIKQNDIAFPFKDDIIEYLYSSCFIENQFSFTHMDFHAKNIIKEDENIFFIDYENISISHPWRDLVYACFFHNNEEDFFWKQFLDEYLGGNIPVHFWESMKYFVYIHLLRMIICEYQNKHYDEIHKLANSVTTGFSLLSSPPRWFS